MTWIKSGDRMIADGYRYEIWRKFSSLWVLELRAAGKLVAVTHHSTLTAAKAHAADQRGKREHTDKKPA